MPHLGQMVGDQLCVLFYVIVNICTRFDIIAMVTTTADVSALGTSLNISQAYHLLRNKCLLHAFSHFNLMGLKHASVG